MNEDIRAQWTAALRSGEYAQGQRFLRVTDPDTGETGYCCLGVLCELAVQAGIVTRDGTRYDGEQRILPLSVRNWAGLADSYGNPVVQYKLREASLAELNDGSLEGMNGRGLNFSQIADIIDAQL